MPTATPATAAAPVLDYAWPPDLEADAPAGCPAATCAACTAPGQLVCAARIAVLRREASEIWLAHPVNPINRPR